MTSSIAVAGTAFGSRASASSSSRVALAAILGDLLTAVPLRPGGEADSQRVTKLEEGVKVQRCGVALSRQGSEELLDVKWSARPETLRSLCKSTGSLG